MFEPEPQEIIMARDAEPLEMLKKNANRAVEETIDQTRRA
jgi:hypothetical protein